VAGSRSRTIFYSFVHLRCLGGADSRTEASRSDRVDLSDGAAVGASARESVGQREKSKLSTSTHDSRRSRFSAGGSGSGLSRRVEVLDDLS